jgi:hypothetical protein
MYGCVYVRVRARVCMRVFLRTLKFLLIVCQNTFTFHSLSSLLITQRKRCNNKKSPRSTEKRAPLVQHKYVDLFELQRNPTEDLKNFSFQRDFYLIELFLLDK